MVGEGSHGAGEGVGAHVAAEGAGAHGALHTFKSQHRDRTHARTDTQRQTHQAQDTADTQTADTHTSDILRVLGRWL